MNIVLIFLSHVLVDNRGVDHPFSDSAVAQWVVSSYPDVAILTPAHSPTEKGKC